MGPPLWGPLMPHHKSIRHCPGIDRYLLRPAHRDKLTRTALEPGGLPFCLSAKRTETPSIPALPGAHSPCLLAVHVEMSQIRGQNDTYRSPCLCWGPRPWGMTPLGARRCETEASVLPAGPGCRLVLLPVTQSGLSRCFRDTAT